MIVLTLPSNEPLIFTTSIKGVIICLKPNQPTIAFGLISKLNDENLVLNLFKIPGNEVKFYSMGNLGLLLEWELS